MHRAVGPAACDQLSSQLYSQQYIGLLSDIGGIRQQLGQTGGLLAGLLDFYLYVQPMSNV